MAVLSLQFVLILLCFYVVLVGVMYWRQDTFIFFPTKNQHNDHGYSEVVEYSLSRGSTQLRGWLVNPRYARERLVLYYGGNAEDIFLNVEEFIDFQAAVLLVPYRGYAPNRGKPGEAELFADGLAVFDDISASYPRSRVFLFGRSLGSAVAVYIAAKRRVAGAILVTPFDSLVNLAKKHYPWLPVSILLRHRFHSVAYLPEIGCPMLILYGGRDTVVPPENTKKLIARIEGDKQVVLIEAADHNTIAMYPQYWQAVLEFLGRQ